MTNLGERIKQIRKKNKLSQAELGHVLYPGVSKAAAESRVKRFEVNGQQPTIEELTRIAGRLRCNINWLLTGKEADQSAEKIEEETELKDEGWELKMLIESMTKRIDDLANRHEAVVTLLTKQRDEITSLRGFGGEMMAQISVAQQSIKNVNAALDEINSRLITAAATGDLSLLKKACGE